MELRFLAEPETGVPHMYKHGVREHEVEKVLEQAGEDRPGRDGARVAIGRTDAGRYLRVIYVPESGGAFVITAYDLHGKLLKAYKRRRRRGRQ